MSNKSVFLLLVFAGSAAIIGQTPAKERKLVAKPVSDQPSVTTPPMPEASGMPTQISGGVLNGKAVSLPKPAYPPAARAVNAEGAVTVQVLIDEEGNVVSANAVSGHPLLRAAAVEAARGARFSPTRLLDQPVKVSGVITYNFVGAFTPGMLGYEIGFAERSGTFAENSFAKSLAARLPEEWDAEKEILDSLTYEPLPEPKTDTAAKTAHPRDGNKYTVMGVSSGNFSYAQRRLTPESIESLRRLQAAAETKLGGDERMQWHFKLGRSLGIFVAEIEDDSRTRINLADLQQLAANKPAVISPSAVTRINDLIEQARTIELGAEGRKALVGGAQGLRNLRISQW